MLLTKFSFRILCQKYRYILYMCIGFYPCTSCFKCCLISCFCIYTSFRENRFSFQNSSLENNIFGLKLNFHITKIVQIVWNMCWILVTHICSSNIYKNLFLWILCDFMCIFKRSSFQAQIWAHWRSTDCSTAPELGLPGGRLMCTDVHSLPA